MAPEAGPGWGGPGRSPQVSRDQGEIFGRPGAAEQTSFYAQLYLGLYHEARGDATQARDYMIRVLPPPITPHPNSPDLPSHSCVCHPRSRRPLGRFALPRGGVEGKGKADGWAPKVLQRLRWTSREEGAFRKTTAQLRGTLLVVSGGRGYSGSLPVTSKPIRHIKVPRVLVCGLSHTIADNGGAPTPLPCRVSLTQPR